MGLGVAARRCVGRLLAFLPFLPSHVVSSQGSISIAVEYMDGGSLQDIVDTGGCTAESVLANIAFRVLLGLEFVHRGRTIHRDIKPSNLLINHLGDVKVRQVPPLQDPLTAS